MSLLRKAYWFLDQQIGIDLRRLFKAPLGIARYVRGFLAFRARNPYTLRIQPCLHDWWEQAGATGTEYFWQDLAVARLVFEANPRRHIDVGSRLDGFVAHVACFRSVEVFDVRPLESTIPNVTFRQADMMNGDAVPEAAADSVSCLHAIEHFGLGRYGDPINPDGTALGISNLAKMLEPGGTLYLSCPVGEDDVFFNAHRALRPATIESLCSKNGLSLVRCMLFDNRRKALDEVQPPLSSAPVSAAHSLGIYVFRKLPQTSTRPV